MYCRFCDITGLHWTSKCTNRGSRAEHNNIHGRTNYIPPSNRSTIQHQSTRRRSDDNQIRVSNLPDNITRHDLYDLFCPFGSISRTYIAFDRNTHISRGFAFITYQSYDNALSAVNHMNLYVLHDRILNVSMLNNNYE